MVTIIAINLGYVVAGAITAEIVFNWPGLGTLTVDALATRDYPVLQGSSCSSPSPWSRQPRRRPRLRLPRSAGPRRERDRRSPATGPGAERWPAARPHAPRDFLRRFARPDRRGDRARDPASCSRSSALFPNLFVGPLETVTTATGEPLEPPSRGPHLRHRRARPGHAQPDGPRGADLDDDRAPGDAHHGPHRGLDRHRRGLRGRRGRQRPDAPDRLLPRPADVRPGDHPRADHPRHHRRRRPSSSASARRCIVIVVVIGAHVLGDDRPRSSGRQVLSLRERMFVDRARVIGSEPGPDHAPAHPAERREPDRGPGGHHLRRRGLHRDEPLVHRPRRPVRARRGASCSTTPSGPARRASGRGGTSPRRPSASCWSSSRSRSSATRSMTSSNPKSATRR